MDGGSPRICVFDRVGVYARSLFKNLLFLFPLRLCGVLFFVNSLRICFRRVHTFCAFHIF